MLFKHGADEKIIELLDGEEKKRAEKTFENLKETKEKIEKNSSTKEKN